MNASIELRQRDRWAMILAAGEGKRLRSYIHRVAGRECPKQYFPLIGTTTLLEQTLARVWLRLAPERTLAVVNYAHRSFYGATLETHPELELLVQPDDRGTAPAILYGLLVIAKRSSKAVVAIFPSDHYVADDERFMQYVDSAFDSILRHPEKPVVLGVAPSRPELGYGWIEPGRPISNSTERPVFQISGFWEKPPLHIARELFRRSCLLNTFIIVGTVSSLIATMASALASMYTSLNAAQSALGHGLEDIMIRAIYSRISRVDFSQSVLAAHADKFAVLPVSDLEWTDLGVPERAITLRSREVRDHYAQLYANIGGIEIDRVNRPSSGEARETRIGPANSWAKHDGAVRLTSAAADDGFVDCGPL